MNNKETKTNNLIIVLSTIILLFIICLYALTKLGYLSFNNNNGDVSNKYDSKLTISSNNYITSNSMTEENIYNYLKTIKGNWANISSINNNECTGDIIAILTTDDVAILSGKINSPVSRKILSVDKLSDNRLKIEYEELKNYPYYAILDLSKTNENILKVAYSVKDANNGKFIDYTLVDKNEILANNINKYFCNWYKEHNNSTDNDKLTNDINVSNITISNPYSATMGGSGKHNTLFIDTNVKLNCDNNQIAGIRLSGYCLDKNNNKYIIEGPIEVAAFYCSNNPNYSDNNKMYVEQVFDANGNQILNSNINWDNVEIKYCKIDKGTIIKSDSSILNAGKEINYEKNITSDTFNIDGNGEGKVQVTGYAYTVAHTDEDNEKHNYVFFKIIENNSSNFMKYLKSMEGNSFIDDNAIGLGCLTNNIITYVNASDENKDKGEKYTLSAEVTKKIMDSNSNNLIKLELEKNKLTNGGSTGSSCYSHITKIKIVD